MERVHSLLDPTTPQIVVSSCLEGKLLKIYFSSFELTFARPGPTDHRIEEELSDHPEIPRDKNSFTMKHQLLPGSLRP